MWYHLRRFPVRILRQRPIGNSIVDYYIPSKKIVVEIDGGQHYTEKGKQYDERRTALLEEFGLTVLRYSNADVKERVEAVCMDIWRKIRET